MRASVKICANLARMDQRIGLTLTDEDQELVHRIQAELEKQQGKASQTVAIRYALRTTAAQIDAGKKKRA